MEAQRNLMEEKYETNIANLQKNLKRYYSQELDVSPFTFTDRTNECTKPSEYIACHISERI